MRNVKSNKNSNFSLHFQYQFLFVSRSWANWSFALFFLWFLWGANNAQFYSAQKKKISLIFPCERWCKLTTQCKYMILCIFFRRWYLSTHSLALHVQLLTNTCRLTKWNRAFLLTLQEIQYRFYIYDAVSPIIVFNCHRYHGKLAFT